MDMDTKNKLEKLDTMMEQLQLIQEQMKSEQEQRHMEILIALKSLKANGSADSSSAEVEGDQLPIEILETRVPIPPEQSSAEGSAGLPQARNCKIFQILISGMLFVHSRGH